jgi:hypothetical protein
MTNPMKGEIQVELAGKQYTCRLTIDSIIQIETAVGAGIIKLAQRMSEGDVRITDMLQVLTPALRGGGNNLKLKDVTKLIGEAGIVETASAVALILTQTIAPEEAEDSGEAEEGKLDDAE